MKPGIKTTEFWGKVFLQIAVILNATLGLGIELSSETAVIIVAGMEALYGVGRSIVKAPPKVEVVNK